MYLLNCILEIELYNIMKNNESFKTSKYNSYTVFIYLIIQKRILVLINHHTKDDIYKLKQQRNHHGRNLNY